MNDFFIEICIRQGGDVESLHWRPVTPVEGGMFRPEWERRRGARSVWPLCTARGRMNKKMESREYFEYVEEDDKKNIKQDFKKNISWRTRSV